MATTSEYAQLSSSVYHDPDSPTPPPVGWESLKVSDPDPSGFYAEAYKNTLTGEIVVAYRGTDDVPDVWTDLALRNSIPPQLGLGVDFYNKIAANNPGAIITVSGHSLGGAIAQYVSAKSNYSPNGVTFGAPPITQVPGVDPTRAGTMVNYVNPNDPIFLITKKIGGHVGEVIYTEEFKSIELATSYVIVAGSLPIVMRNLLENAKYHYMDGYRAWVDSNAWPGEHELPQSVVASFAGLLASEIGQVPEYQFLNQEITATSIILHFSSLAIGSSNPVAEPMTIEIFKDKTKIIENSVLGQTVVYANGTGTDVKELHVSANQEVETLYFDGTGELFDSTNTQIAKILHAKEFKQYTYLESAVGVAGAVAFEYPSGSTRTLFTDGIEIFENPVLGTSYLKTRPGGSTVLFGANDRTIFLNVDGSEYQVDFGADVVSVLNLKTGTSEALSYDDYDPANYFDHNNDRQYGNTSQQTGALGSGVGTEALDASVSASQANSVYSSNAILWNADQQAALSELSSVQLGAANAVQIIAQVNLANLKTLNQKQNAAGCFAADTPVMMADGSEKNIASVSPGDQVMAFDGVGALQPRSVVRTFTYDDKELVNLSGVKCTPTHPFLTKDGRFVPALKIAQGAALIDANGIEVEAGALSPVEGRQTVYNFEVEDLHTYVAGGMRVHNSSGTTPVALDLNGDNVIELIGIEASEVFFDVDGDGFDENTGWVGTSDGLLAIDIDGDGTISHADEIVFTNHAAEAKTDLEAISLAFDSNHDGLLSSYDLRWNDFRVWQDLDQDGVADTGEVKTLGEWGITSIPLTTNGAMEIQDHNRIFGTANYTKSDGSVGLLADAEFAFVDNGIQIEGVGEKTVRAVYEDGTREIRVRGGQRTTMDMAAQNADRILGGDFADVIFTTGDQAIEARGNGGRDFIRGGAGDDFIDGGDDRDNLKGGVGSDVIQGGDDADSIDGGSGNDVIFGDATLQTNDAGDDTINGGAGDDHIYGDGGDLTGLAGNDVINGGAGNDTIYGDAYNIKQRAGHTGGGHDVITGGAGDDTIIGGLGDDVAVFSGNQSDYEITITDNITTVRDLRTGPENEGTDTIRGVERLRFADGEILAATGNAAPDAKTDWRAGETLGADSIIITAASLLKNDIDLDGDAFSITQVGDVRNGTAEIINANGDIRFTPDPGFLGNARFTYWVKDARSGVATATAMVKVNSALPTDDLYSTQWYLNKINVQDVWDGRGGKSYTGAGVFIADLEGDGVDYLHPDLSANYDTTRDYDLIDGDGDPYANSANDKHSSPVIGIMAAARNGMGTTGVAYDATVALFRAHWATSGGALDTGDLLDRVVEADVANLIGVYGNPFEYSFNDPLYADWGGKLQNAADAGRSGLGTVMAVTGGNQRNALVQSGTWYPASSTNYNNYANSRFSISVGAVNEYGKSTFSSPGAALLVTSPGVYLNTTDVQGAEGYNDGSQRISADYTNFAGTCGGTPIVSAVCALMLEANPALGYRDVQEILAYSSMKTDKSNAESWSYNAATNWNGGGLHVSNDYGFGMVNAHAAVRLAETWQEQSTFANEMSVSATSSPALTISDHATVSDAVSVTSDLALEYVEVDLDISHANIGDLIVTLVSPDGTESVLMDRPGKDPGTPTDTGSNLTSLRWTFTSTHHWGEVGNGEWTLKITDAATGSTGTLNNWNLRLFGGAQPINDTYIYTNEFYYEYDLDRAVLGDADGGVDTLNLSTISYDAQIDLRPGQQSYIMGHAVDMAPGSEIENVHTGDGNDLIIGGNLANTLKGWRGDDHIEGGSGADILDGGSGRDTLRYKYSAQGVTVDLATGAAIGGDAQGDQFFNFENLWGSEFSDSLTGDAGDNRISGQGGDDMLFGQSGSDTLFGGAGDDLLNGGLGADTLEGGDGHDTLSYASSSAGVSVSLATGIASGGEAEGDTFSTVEDLIGSDHNDQLTGNAENNTLTGGAGNDTLAGEAGVDTVVFSGAQNEYDLRMEGDVLVVTHTPASGVGDGIDRLTGIERARFSDVLIDLDSTYIKRDEPAATIVMPKDFGQVLGRLDASTGVSYTLIGAASNGTVSVNPDGSFSYTPAPGFIGQDRFTVEITGADGAIGSRWVSVDVKPSYQDIEDLQLNTWTANDQHGPSLGSFADGGFISVWGSLGQDGSDYGVYGRRFDSTGTPVGSEFKINDNTLGRQRMPSVATFDDGGFVVTWHTSHQDGSGYAINGRRFDANGNALGTDFQINTFTFYNQLFPVVEALSDGGFVVAWESSEQDGSGEGIYAQRFDANGQAVGGEFRVNTSTQGDQHFSSVAALTDGGFVMSWQSQNADGNGSSIFTQRYNASGNKVGGETLVDTLAITGDRRTDQQSITALPDGGYVAAWFKSIKDASGYIGTEELWSRKYSADGTPGATVQTSVPGPGVYTNPEVTVLADGTHQVIWENSWTKTLYITRYGADGSLLSQNKLGSFDGTHFANSGVVSLSDGDVAVSWHSTTATGSGLEVLGTVVPAGRYVDFPSFKHTGTADPDFLIGGDGDDVFSGGAGNDYIEGGIGSDVLDGGAGVDTASYVANAEGVTVDLVAGSSSGGNAEGDTLTNFENLTGSAHADTLLGDHGNNVLIGGAGDDLLEGRGGADHLDGGAGIDTARYASSASAVQINLAQGIGHGGDGEGDILSSIEDVEGSSHADTLVGDSGNNTFIGGKGDDVLDGGGGEDVAVFSGNVSDYTITSNPDGSVTVADKRLGGDGVDTLVNVEKGRFADFTINVDGVNNAPIAQIDMVATDEDVSITIAASHLLSNDWDFESNPFTLTSVDSISGCAVALGVGGDVVFTPLKNFNGQANFNYTITDSLGANTTQNVTVNITSVNDAPITVANRQAIPINQISTGTLTAIDPDGDQLTYALLSGPQHGTLTLEEGGGYSYTPDDGFIGSDSFAYQATDTQGLQSIGGLDIGVGLSKGYVSQTDPFQIIGLLEGSGPPPKVVRLGESYFLAVAVSNGADDAEGVNGQLFDHYGQPVGEVFQISDKYGLNILENSDGSVSVIVSDSDFNQRIININESGVVEYTHELNSKIYASKYYIRASTLSSGSIAILHGTPYSSEEIRYGGVIYEADDANNFVVEKFSLSIPKSADASAYSLTIDDLVSLSDGGFVVAARLIEMSASGSINRHFIQKCDGFGNAFGQIEQVQWLPDAFLPLDDGGYLAIDATPFFVAYDENFVRTDAVALSTQRYDASGMPTGEASEIRLEQATFSGSSSYPLELSVHKINGAYTLSMTRNGENGFGYGLEFNGAGVSQGDIFDFPAHSNVAISGDRIFSFSQLMGADRHYVGAERFGQVFTYFSHYDGTESNDSISGDIENNTIVGNAGDDVLDGADGADVLSGGPGNDVLIGGLGADTALYSGNIADYEIHTNGDGTFTVTDLRGVDGADRTSGIERFEFADGVLTIDDLNTAPVAQTAQLAGDEDAVSSGALNAVDADGDVLTFTLVQGPAKGTVVLQPDGAYTFDPAGAFEPLNEGLSEDVSFIYSVFDGRASVQKTATITVTGHDEVSNGNVVDGYVEGATIFADANGNGLIDEDESMAITGTDGSFSLQGEGTLVVSGGVDASTGLAFKGTMKATAGSEVVTPLTTLVATLVEKGQTVDQAQTAVKTAFGIDSTVDLTKLDPVQATQSTNAAEASVAAKVMAAGVLVESTLVQATSAVAGSGAQTQEASNAVIGALADAITVSGSMNLTDVTVVQQILSQAVNSVDVAPIEKQKVIQSVDAIASVITQSNTKFTETLNAGVVGDELLVDLAQIAHVAQGAASDQIQQAVISGDQATLDQVVQNFSNANLEAAIVEAANNIGDVDGTEFGTAVADVLTGGNGVDTIDGLGGDDVINGLGGNDRLSGAEGHDSLNGGIGDDHLSGGAGNDMVVGGEGLDVAEFSGAYSDYHALLHDDGTITISDLRGIEGTDTLVGVETLKFSDGTVQATDINQAPKVSGPLSYETAEDNALIVSAAELLANATDANADVLSVAGLTIAHGQGVIVDNGNGTWTITPAENWHGAIKLNYSVSDGAEIIPATADVQVNSVNDAPQVQADQTLTQEDVSLVLSASSVLANDFDVEGEALTITSVQDSQGGTVSLNVDGNITFTPHPNYHGSASFKYTVADGSGGLSTASVQVDVASVNDAPVSDGTIALDVIGDQTLLLSEAALLANAVDVDGDLLSVTNLSVTGGSLIDNGNRTWTFTPANEQAAKVSLTYSVTDGTVVTPFGASITVIPPNDPPVAVADVISATEDALLSIDVLANDLDTDLDDIHTVDSVALVSGLGAASIVANQVVYDPTAYQFLAEGETAQVELSYTMSDNHGAASTSTVSITVTGTNDGPVANADAGATDEDTLVSIDVLANDIDVDLSDTHTVDAVSVTDGLGAASIVANQVVYDPTAYQFLAEGETAQVELTYTMSDNHGAASTSTVSITVTGTNDGPVANADAGATDEDTLVSIDVLANDIDVDLSDSHTVDAVSVTNGLGVASIVANQVVYDPTAYQHLALGETAQVELTYTMSDNHGAASTSTVSITVTGTNDAPVAAADLAVTHEDAALTIQAADLLANDRDIDASDVLSIVSLDSTATLGSVVDNGDGTFSYDPSSAYQSLGLGEVATDSFTYTVSDGNGGTATATATVYVTVKGANDRPVAVADNFVTSEDTALTFSTTALLANDSDVDASDVLSILGFDTTGLQGSVADNGDGTFSYDPGAAFQHLAEGETASDTFTYVVSDGKGGTARTTVTMTVTGTNDVPVATADSLTAGEDTGLTFSAADLLANDSDIDASDVLSIASLDTTATQGSVIDNGDGTYSYEPGLAFHSLAAGETATDTFSYTISDGHGGSATATVTMTIIGANDAPVAMMDALGSVDTYSAVSITASQLLANDYDPDARDTLSITSVGNAVNGQVVMTESGEIFFQPDLGYAGTATFDYTVSDGNGGTATATASIESVLPTNLIMGTERRDRLKGDRRDNVIDGRGGDDKLYGRKGDDILVGGAGDDKMSGDKGDDVFLVSGANTGVDEFKGGKGFDTIRGSIGDDVIGMEEFEGDNSIELIDGGLGVNIIRGTADEDELDFSRTTLTNIDLIDGGAGDDEIEGSAGTDVIVGGVGDDEIEGGAGDDVITGGAGDDDLEGGAGNDTFLVSGQNDGFDEIKGGAGFDRIIGSDGDDVIGLRGDDDHRSDHDHRGHHGHDDGSFSIEEIDGGAGINIIQGSKKDDELDFSQTTLTNIDLIDGGAGNDEITGSVGHDVIAGGTGNDEIDGGAGTDTAVFSGDFADYKITQKKDGSFVVHDLRWGGHHEDDHDDDDHGDHHDHSHKNHDGQDRIVNVERLQFADRTVYLMTNHSPVSFSDWDATYEDVALTIPAADLLSNDVDLDGDKLQIEAIGAAVGGFVSFNGDGDIIFVPEADFSGDATFEYAVSDGHGGTAISTVTIAVEAVADASSLTTTAASGAEDLAVALDIAAELQDVDGSETLDITISNVPAGAVLNVGINNGDGSWNLQPSDLLGLSLTPPQDFSGHFDLTVTATTRERANGHTAQSVSVMTVDVTAVADAPSVSTQAVAGAEDSLIALNIASQLNDTDGSETLSLLIKGVPLDASLSAGIDHGDGSWTLQLADLVGLALTPPPDFSGAFDMTVTAIARETANGNAASALSTFLVTVYPVADGPSLVTAHAYGDEDIPVILDITSQLTDISGTETLQVTIDGMPEGGSLSSGVLNADGSWTLNAEDLSGLMLTPPTGFNGTFDLDVTATSRETANGATASVSERLTVVVEPLNETLLVGGDRADVLSGGQYDDVLVGGRGNDVLVGNGGSDTYQFSRDSGQDTLINSSENGPSGRMHYADVAHDELWFSQNGSDLIVNVIGTDNAVTVSGWYEAAENQVSTITTADGYQLNSSNVDFMVNAMAAMTPPPAGQINLSDNERTALATVIAVGWQ